MGTAVDGSSEVPPVLRLLPGGGTGGRVGELGRALGGPRSERPRAAGQLSRPGGGGACLRGEGWIGVSHGAGCMGGLLRRQLMLLTGAIHRDGGTLHRRQGVGKRLGRGVMIR